MRFQLRPYQSDNQQVFKINELNYFILILINFLMQEVLDQSCKYCGKQVPRQFINIHQYNCLKRRRNSKIRSSSIMTEVVMIPCTQCGQSFPFQQFSFHYEECPGMQNKRCNFCKVIYPTYLMDEHYEVCQQKRAIQEQQRERQPQSQLQRPGVDIGQLLNLLSQSNNSEQSQQEGGLRNLLLLAHLLRGLNKEQGLKPEDVAKLKPTKSRSGDGNCTVCYCELEDNEQIYNLHCEHKFHIECLKPWLEKNQHCPLCRKHVLEQ